MKVEDATLYFLADSNGKRCELIGSLRWAGPYCFQCDVSLVTGRAGGYNVSDNPLRFIAFQHIACPLCQRDTNNAGNQGSWGPTDQELVERKKYQRPVWYATAFIYNISPEQVARFQKETEMIDSLGNRMTVGFFREKKLKEAKYHYYPAGRK